ncbi:MAG: beta-hydroxyacyl-ACP dehydratase [Victivallales bacterium]|nr:beta-hydroxyacyl-ACP dehydratase [Victivallales bacterium]
MPKPYSYKQLVQTLELTAPILMLDEAQIADDYLSGKGCKLMSINEPVFQGHFPGQPITPGVLQIAAMAQLSNLIFRLTIPVIAGTKIMLRHIQRLKFRKPVLPGMRLTVESKLLERRANHEADFQVTCTTDAGVASAGTITLARVSPSLQAEKTVMDKCRPSPFAEEMAGLQQFSALDLMKYLPHRPPFLLIDHAMGIGGPGKKVCGYKNITGNDFFLAGDASGCYPSELLIESGAQLGCAHVLAQPENAGHLGIFLCIDEAHFYDQARPGDQLVIHGTCDPNGHAGIAAGEFWVGDRKIAESSMKFVVLPSLG